MRARSFRSFSLAVCCSLCVLACGAETFDGVVYHSSDLRFRVGPIPGGWRRIEVDDARLAFRDDQRGITVALNGRCGVDGDDVPLGALTQHLFLTFTDRQMVDQKRLMLDGRAALRTEAVAALDGVPKHYTVYVLKKDGCVYDFMRIAAREPAGSGTQDFDRFVLGFATLE